MTTHYDRDTLIDYLHRELSPEIDARVFTHLEACGTCAAAYDEEASLGELLRSAARSDERELPSLVKARVWDAVRNERPSWRERVIAGWIPRLALPVAAAAALALYFGLPGAHPSQPVTPAGITAAFYLDEHGAAAQTAPLGPGLAPAVYGSDAADRQSPSSAASYIDTADAATLDDASGVLQ